MKSQKGSVLAGVLGLGLAMTIAAAGLITTAANVSGTEVDSGRDLQLHYAAEAGMQMGIRWTRTINSVDLENSAWPDGQPFYVITRGDAGFETINGMRVKVVLLDGATGVAKHLIQVIAKDPTRARGNLEITWRIDAASGVAGQYPIVSKPSLSTWKETYNPYVP